MAFDDLTPNQRDTLIRLIEALDTGNYNDEFVMLRRAGRHRGDIHLYRNDGPTTYELEGFTASDTEALKEEGYITLASGSRATLKPKAQQQYKLYKDPLALYSELEVAPNMRLDHDSSVTEPPKHGEDAAAKYIYLDVVGFTHNRTLEAQSDIIELLNVIVLEAVEVQSIPEDKLIFIPTGDGICVVLIGVESPADVHVQIALNILGKVRAHNAATQDETYRFQVRIGIDANTDTLVSDINRRQNIAGEGISMASRIMNLADGNQILVGQNVYNTLRQRQRYISAFREHQATVKHGKSLHVYQLISDGLNNGWPRALMPEATAQAVQETATPAVNKAECPDKQLHEIAASDKRNISKYVWIIYRRIDYEGLKATDPYIEINFDIINASVYSISIDKKIEDGAVYLNGEELNPRMTKIEGLLQNISRDDIGDNRGILVIKQWLTPALVARISDPSPGDEIRLGGLKVMVKGADDSQGIAPQRLSLPRSIPIALSSPSGTDKWLRNIAERDRRDIDTMVKVIDCTFNNQCGAATPYVDFQFVIFNGSVFPISIEPKVEGLISYGDRRLTGGLTVSLKWRVENMERGYHARFEIRQWLTKEEAEFIRNDTNPHGAFNFEHLTIIITGGGEHGNVLPKPLRFGFSTVRLNGTFG